MPTGAEIIASAQKHLGKRYVYGTNGPNTFDCSGLVQYVFKQYGISLPHHAASQAQRGTAVSKNDIQPGDLVFSNWGDGPNSHVGIAVSSGRIIDAPNSRSVVRYDNLSSGYLSHVTAVRRIKGVTNSGAGAGTSTAGTSSGATTPGSDTAGSTSGGGGSPSGGGSSGGVLGGIADAIRTALTPLTSVQTFSDTLMKAWLPTTIIRVVCGVAGLLFIAWGTVLLARETREA